MFERRYHDHEYTSPTRLLERWEDSMKKFASIVFCAIFYLLTANVSTPYCRDLYGSTLTEATNPYSDANALILKSTKEIRLTNDKIIEHKYTKIKIINQKGRERFGFLRERYNEDKEKVDILKAWTIKPDGDTIHVPKNAINIVTPGEIVNYPEYANIKEVVVAFVGLEPGCVIELETQKISKEERNVQGEEPFQATEPIGFKVLSVTIPKAMNLHFAILNGAPEPKIIEGENDKTYKWEVSDIDKIIEEKYMPSLSYFVPRVVYTTQSSWSQASKEIAKEFFTKIKLTSEIKSRTKALVKTAKTDAEKIERIALFVINNIRNIDLDLETVGYTPKSPSLVLKNKLGTSTDKVALLITMLSGLGIRAYPVFVHTSKASFVEDVACFPQFDKIIAYVEWDEQRKFIDLTLDDATYGYLENAHGKRALIVKEDTFDIINVPSISLDKNLSQVNMRIDFNPDSISAIHIDCNLNGYFDQRCRNWLGDLTKDKLDRFFIRQVSKFGQGAKLESYKISELDDITTPVNISMDISLKKIEFREGSLVFLYVPEISLGFADLPLKASSLPLDRHLPLALPSSMAMRRIIMVDVPEGYSPYYVPEDTTISDVLASFSMKTTAEGGKLILAVNVLIPKDLYTQEEYKTLRNTLAQLEAEKNNLIILIQK